MSRISAKDKGNGPQAGAERTESPQQSRWSSWLIGLFQLVFTCAAIGFVLYTVDLSAAWNYALGQDPTLLAAAAAVIVLQILFGALRWFVILRQLGAQVGVGDTMRAFYIGSFFNTCLWSSVGGDIARSWLAYRARVSVGTSINSVLLDHVAALVGIAIIVLVTAPWFVTRAGDVMPV